MSYYLQMKELQIHILKTIDTLKQWQQDLKDRGEPDNSPSILLVQQLLAERKKQKSMLYEEFIGAIMKEYMENQTGTP